MTNQPASDTPRPQINAQAFWVNNCHVIDYEVAFEIEKGLLAHIARLSAEREKERTVIEWHLGHIERTHHCEGYGCEVCYALQEIGDLYDKGNDRKNHQE